MSDKKGGGLMVERTGGKGGKDTVQWHKGYYELCAKGQTYIFIWLLYIYHVAGKKKTGKGEKA